VSMEEDQFKSPVDFLVPPVQGRRVFLVANKILGEEVNSGVPLGNGLPEFLKLRR